MPASRGAIRGESSRSTSGKCGWTPGTGGSSRCQEPGRRMSRSCWQPTVTWYGGTRASSLCFDIGRRRQLSKPSSSNPPFGRWRSDRQPPHTDPVTWWHRIRALPPWCLAALCVGLVRLPFLDLRLGADEGGFLAVGGQWHPGTSLYGDYWVDRPPLLIAVFALASALGGTIALRLIGLAAAVAAVVLAGWVGRLVGGRAGSTVASVATAALVCTPWFDGLEISGELLALPLVLAGVGCVVSADQRSCAPGSRGGWDWRWAAAGALGAGAFL